MGFFSAPKVSVPKPPPLPDLPAAPTEAERAAELAAAREEDRLKRKTQAGRAATILTTGDDTTVSGSTVKRKLGM